MAPEVEPGAVDKAETSWDVGADHQEENCAASCVVRSIEITRGCGPSCGNTVTTNSDSGPGNKRIAQPDSTGARSRLKGTPWADIDDESEDD